MATWLRLPILGGFVAWLALSAACGPYSATTSSAPDSVLVRETDEAAARRALQRLLLLMRQRLALMHDVARWKWNENKPVEDREREQTFLDQVVRQGLARGLEPGSTRRFFAAQIEASKVVQRDDLAAWEGEGRGHFRDVPDLIKEQRPRLDALNEDLLAALAEAKPYLDQGELVAKLRTWSAEMLVGDGITDAVRKAALEPFE